MPVFVKVSVVHELLCKTVHNFALQCVSVLVMLTVVHTMTLLDLASAFVPIVHRVLCVKNVLLDSIEIQQCFSQILA